MSRRIYKETTAAAPQGAGASLYHYEGWNLCAEYTATSISSTTTSSITALQRTYTWGPDLSGSMQGAGGVGGLLTIEEKSGPHTGKYYPLYDGNGNVTELIKSGGPTGTTLVAHYEYDPFGNLTQSDDSDGSGYNAVNPWQFSTKYHDQETGFSYYGYRYYDPVTGRWPSRDPIGERGGVNLYGFVMNGSTNAYDFLGLAKRPNCEEFLEDYMTYGERGMGGDQSGLPGMNGWNADDVYDEVGDPDIDGDLDDLHDSGDADYAESCALRMSLNLNSLGGGHEIPPGSTGFKNRNGGYENRDASDELILSAKKMREHLNKIWGHPDAETEAEIDPENAIDPYVHDWDGISSAQKCSCFCIVHASDRHIGFIDYNGLIDGSGPLPHRNNPTVDYWRLPCSEKQKKDWLQNR